MKSPPLGGTRCPDPRYGAGRGLVLQGPQTFLGARYLLTASFAGQPASTPGPPPPILPSAPEGAIPFIEDTGTVLEVQPPAGAVEGSTAFVEETSS
jgi:hypothetical protein